MTAGLGGAPDSSIAAFCLEEGRALLILDLDFWISKPITDEKRCLRRSYPDGKAYLRPDARMEHIQKFLLELGQGFSFVGCQVHLELGDEDFYLDLLFYHLKLRCYVVIKLKARKIEPGDGAKLGMYMTATSTFRQAGRTMPCSMPSRPYSMRTTSQQGGQSAVRAHSVSYLS